MENKRHGTLLPLSISYVMFGIIGFLFVFFCLTGRDLAQQGNIAWTRVYVLRTLGLGLALGGILGAGVCFLLRRTASAKVEKVSAESKSFAGKGVILFFLSLGASFSAWIPGLLAYYPAICAYDMPIQMGQIVSGEYINHHPIAHTLLIKWMVMLGEALFGSEGGTNAGIALYAVFQMIFLASAFAAILVWLRNRNIKRVWLWALQLSYMLYPFHWYMSISVTKDTVFSAFFVLQILAILKILEKAEIRNFILFTISSIGMILFRNNGRYAFLVLLFFLLVALAVGKDRRHFWGKFLVWALGAFLAGNLMLAVVYRTADADQGDKREMLSMPIQQLARTMIYHGGVGMLQEDDGTMGETDKALINDFILNEAYRKYRPDFADPVKSNTNTSVVRYRTKEFISSYFRLLSQYPGDFINAALAVDAGYLYPGDVSHAWVNAQPGQAAGGGYAQTRWDEGTLNDYGIFKDTKWSWLHIRMETWADSNAYLEIPLLKYLFVPGVWVWLYLLLLAWWLLQRKFAQCISLSLVFGYYLTIVLGPTVQLRYIYPIMIVFPFLLLAGRSGGLSRYGMKSEDGGEDRLL